MPLGSGHLCHNCRRARHEERPQVGSIGREIAAKRQSEAAKRAELLIVLAGQETPAAAPQQTIVAVAAEQLAAAWGVKFQRARCK